MRKLSMGRFGLLAFAAFAAGCGGSVKIDDLDLVADAGGDVEASRGDGAVRPDAQGGADVVTTPDATPPPVDVAVPIDANPADDVGPTDDGGTLPTSDSGPVNEVGPTTD